MFFFFGKYFKLTKIDQIYDFEWFDVFNGFAQKYDLAQYLDIFLILNEITESYMKVSESELKENES